jgi:hypothetical protein
VVETNFRQQVLESEPSLGGLPAAPLILIDDFDAVRGPAQQRGAMHERILPVPGLAMFENLLRCRLANVNDGLSLPMPILDF